MRMSFGMVGSRRSPGVWIGLTVSYLFASLAMVQIRCKVTGGFPCGDWPVHGYTWHFWPPFLSVLLLWFFAGRVWSRRFGRRQWEALCTLGEAVSPMLGLVLAWCWYGLTGPRFHLPDCTVPLLCHDSFPAGILVWSLPWCAWAAWRSVSIWRTFPS